VEAQIIRYRANRKHVFGVLNLGDFECFVRETRGSLLEAGAYQVTLADYNSVVRIGDQVVTHNKFIGVGTMHVGYSIDARDRIIEKEAAGKRLVKEIAKGLQEDSVLNLEIIDEADYDEADSELT
jgi:hypothetical protein